MKRVKLYNENNLEALKKLPNNSIDSVVTDPPYGLSFMNKKWDYDVPSVDFWKEVFRVLKPGGHVLSFGGTRTYHRMVVNMEDAGFEIRDQIMWIYGSGFPKSHNISKAISKINGEDVKIGKAFVVTGNLDNNSQKNLLNGKEKHGEWRHEPTTEEAIEYEGWGTGLKPANEPICLARKPLTEKSVVENVLKYKTGGINVDGCRVGTDSIEGRFPANIILECCCDEVIEGEKCEPRINSRKGGSPIFGSNLSVDYQGKWPNDKGDIHTNPECPCYIMDQQSGESKSVPDKREFKKVIDSVTNFGTGKLTNHNDKGGASRFFYQAKVSKAERNMGLDGFEDKQLKNINQLDDRLRNDGTIRKTPVHRNNHPTVKPINLLTYLCRLVTPENGIVLDPFMGSGSTGIAAQLEGFRFVGMELEPEYFKIAESRIENWEKYKKFLK